MARVMADLVPELLHPTVLDRALFLRLPTLVLWGDADRLVPARSADQLTKQLVRGTFHRLAACGHMPMIERPEATSRALAAFLEPLLKTSTSERRAA